MNDITNMIATLGFPIDMCVGACFFIKYLFDSFTKQMEAQRLEHKEEIKQLQSALENNTVALTRLIEKIDRE